MRRRDFTLLLGGCFSYIHAAPLLAGLPSFVYEVVPAHARIFAENTGRAGRYTFSTPATLSLADATGFSGLKQLNETVQAPSKPVSRNFQHNIEIVTYVLAGCLELSESAGHNFVLRAGEVQALNTGNGLEYSYANPLAIEPAYFVQAAFLANGGIPSCQQTLYSPELKRGRLLALMTPDGEADSMTSHDDYRVYAGDFSGQESASYALAPDSYAYIQVIRGSIKVNGVLLSEGDGIKVMKSVAPLMFEQGINAELLLFVVKAI